MQLDLTTLNPSEKQNWLQSAIAPRPIALVSTVDREGRPNLAPFSFFNLFSYEPPTLIFSPVRRLRDGSSKHTFDNIYDCREVVVHVVTFDMMQQMSLASADYPRHVDEFEKAGFTKQAAFMVRPPMIRECPVKMECRVFEIKPLGKNGGAGNLILAEVIYMHVSDSVLNDKTNGIDQLKLQHLARLGEDWYCKIDESNLFRDRRPGRHLGIGMDALPRHIRESPVLRGNDLAKLALVGSIPVKKGYSSKVLELRLRDLDESKRKREIHRHAKQLLNLGSIDEAWQLLLEFEEYLQ